MQDTSQLLDLLCRTLQVEHYMADSYQQLVDSCPDAETKGMVRKLERESTAHARIVQDAITELGGALQRPEGFVQPALDPEQWFRHQIEWERLALWCHQKACGLCREDKHQRALKAMAEAEQAHIAIVERIILRVSEGSAI